MNETRNPSILVWDAPVRVFHWLLALSFLGAFVTAESERWRLLHVTLGYSAGGLVLFRLLWGLLGTRHARFASFVRGPRAVWRYLRSLAGPAREHHVGHNPAGGWAIVGLLAGVAAVAVTGLALDGGFGGGLNAHWVEETHEVLANLLLVLVGVHVAGVVVSSLLHRENLVASMFSGRKNGPAGAGIGRPWRSVAAVLLAGVLGFWALQWSGPIAGSDAMVAAQTRSHHQGRDDD